MFRRNFFALAFAAVALLAGPANAQTAWPKERELTLIVAVGPGSSAELAAREVARVISRETGASVVVKAIAGGGGIVGFGAVASAKPDGYTMGLVNVGSLVFLPFVQDVPFSIDSFDFLGAVSAGHYGIGVGKNSPIKTIEDLIALGKKRVVTFSTDTVLNALPMFQLSNLTGMKSQIVMTKTQPESVAQAVGGHVDVVVQGLPVMQSIIDAGDMRLLASTTPSRWPTMPNVRTLREMGYNAEVVLPAGYAMPKGVPLAIREKLQEAILKSAKDPALIDMMTKLNIGMMPLTGKEFENFVRVQKPLVGKVVEAAGMAKK
jgi:tripartite-type tricarboxylate transporter receptor subunit TctC